LLTEDLTAEQISELLDSLSLITKVAILEDTLEKEIKGEVTPKIQAINSFFSEVVFRTNEPTQEIEDEARGLAKKGKGQGRKPKYQSKMKSKKIPFHRPEDLAISSDEFQRQGPPVIIHMLLNETNRTRTSYGDTAKYLKGEGQIRIYKTTESIGWRDVSKSEHKVYNNWIKQEISKLIAPYERYPIYGIMIPPSTTLKIRDKENETKERSEDLRTLNIGRVCTYNSMPKIVNILYRLGIKSFIPIPPNITRNEIYRYFTGVDNPPTNLQEKSDEELIHLYGWYRTDFNKNQLCVEIQKYLMRNNMIFTGSRTGVIPGNHAIGSVHSGASLGTPPIISGVPESISTIYPAVPSQTTTTQLGTTSTERILPSLSDISITSSALLPGLIQTLPQIQQPLVTTLSPPTSPVSLRVAQPSVQPIYLPTQPIVTPVQPTYLPTQPIVTPVQPTQPTYPPVKIILPTSQPIQLSQPITPIIPPTGSSQIPTINYPFALPKTEQ